jgi:serine/threonine-protein kinase RsbW
MGEAVRFVTELLQGLEYPEKDVFGVRLSLEEALANAIKHGHNGDASRPVWLNFHADRNGIVLQVQDQGPGFNPQTVPDPRDPEQLERPSGRGLLLMRHYMTQVCHNERGNCVCFCKQVHPASPAPADSACEEQG